MASRPAAAPAVAAPVAEARQGTGAAWVPLWRDPLLALTLLVSLFAVAPFWLPGYFWGANDARHHVYFLHQFNRMWQDGIWWPRWSPDFAFGYGYPFFNIYGPFSHFVAQGLLWWGGLSHTAAIEAVFGLTIVASAAAMYVCARDVGGRAMALVAALVYTFLPYHLLNLYVRANLAESMAFVWLPLCLWAVRRSVVTPHVRWIVAAALAYGGLMLTSNLVIVLFTPALAVYLLLLAWVYALPAGEVASLGRRAGAAIRRALVAALGPIAGLGLSAVFWLPALLEQRYVRVDQWFDGRYNFRGHFVYPHQLFSTQWGFGVSLPGP
ncbi:MAG: 6-pyruvoyl-tetrahydropterin synthase-related protein, partial [Caldilineaceae bacterium]